MKILCLLSWQPKGRWLWNYLPETDHQVDFAFIQHPKDRFAGYGKLLGYYPKFWLLAFKAFPVIKNYDVIVAWEANTALPLAFLRTMTKQNKPPLVVLNFVLKGKPILDAIGVSRYAMHSIDHITCLSQREIEHYSQVLRFPASRCSKLQGPYVPFPTVESPPGESGDYIFSAGRSHRDYHTLVEAVKGLPVRLIINARPFNVRGIQTPENVTINPFLPYDEFLALLGNSKFVVAPLLPAKHASGETFMAQAMSAGKAVIVTETYSTGEMIEDGVNGLLVPPGDVSAMRNAIQFLLDQPEKRNEIGKTARQHYQEHWSFPVVARQVDQLLQQIIHDFDIRN